MENKTYVISIRLMKGCYRHIKISGSCTLDDLARAILDSFKFDWDHLSCFLMDNKRYHSDEEYQVLLDPGMPLLQDKIANNYTLDDLDLYKGQKFIYWYDFGADWTFNCRVLHVLDEETTGWEITRAVGKSPEQYPDFEYDGIW